jgi:hypothetical protein
VSIKEQEFHAAMFDVYRRAKDEYGYNATRFLEMLGEHGGLGTAHILLQAPGVSEGYTALWERGGLEVTVEAVVLNPKWRELFSADESKTARKRLMEYEFDLAGLERKYAGEP